MKLRTAMKNFRRDHDKEKTSERRAGAEGTSWSSGPPSKRARHCIEVTKLNRYYGLSAVTLIKWE